MSQSALRKLVEGSNRHLVALRHERTMHDSLSAQNLTDTDVADRVREISRGGEDRLLDDITAMAQALKSHNRDLERVSRNAVLIAEARQSMEHQDSQHALDATRHEAEATVVELNDLRTIVLRQIATLAEDLYSTDGRSVWTDVQTADLFPGGVDLFPETEAQVMNNLVDGVNDRRAQAARGAEASLADEELDDILF